jgi:hypothetical protein
MNNMNLQGHIRRVLREEVTDRNEKLKDAFKKLNLDDAIKFAGGIDNYIKILYGGDIKQYFKNEDVEPYSIRGDVINMYFDNLLVEHLDLKDFNEREKELGEFSYGNKNGIKFKFTARLYKYKYANGTIGWKVVGFSGDSGFGYSFINKVNILGNRYRKQIFQQIIDKYNLDSYK